MNTSEATNEEMVEWLRAQGVDPTIRGRVLDRGKPRRQVLVQLVEAQKSLVSEGFYR